MGANGGYSRLYEAIPGEATGGYRRPQEHRRLQEVKRLYEVIWGHRRLREAYRRLLARLYEAFFGFRGHL